MTRNLMKRRVTALALLLAASCSGKPEDEQPTPDFGGTWVDCSNDGFNDFRDVFAIDGSNVNVVSYSYATSDGSCGGAATPDGAPVTGTMTLGAPIEAWLNGVAVQATPVDLSWGPYYSILYRETVADTGILYTGDDTATTGLDGSAPDKRPNVLQAWRARVRQTTPSAADLNGTWVACRNNGTNDERQALTISGTSLTSSATTYTSIDNSCTGTATPGSPHTATITVGDPVYSMWGTMTVTSLAVDIADTTNPLYTVMWVDSRPMSVSLNGASVLYVGDEAATPGYAGGTPETRATVLQELKRYVKH